MSLFIPPANRATDANANPLSGAKWYFYVSGGLTPATVYADNALGSSLGSAVTADAGGLFVPIFLNPAIIYRAILKTAAGAVISDVDPYTQSSTGGAVSPAWGSITGTLSAQTDLQTALNAKAGTALFTSVANGITPLSGGGTTNYLRADGTWATPATSVGSVAWGAITGTLSSQSDLNTALAAKAALASPTLTGTPAAPTATSGTSTTQIATTAFVDALRDVPSNAKSANYALALTDRGQGIDFNGTSLTCTIPANASVAFPVGTVIVVTNLNATALSIAITSDTLTISGTTTTGTRALGQNGEARLRKVTSTSWLIGGSGLS